MYVSQIIMLKLIQCHMSIICQLNWKKRRKERNPVSFLPCGPLLAQEFFLIFVPGNIGHSHQNSLSLSCRPSSKAPIHPSYILLPWTWAPYSVFLKLRERVPDCGILSWSACLLPCLPWNGEKHTSQIQGCIQGMLTRNIQIMWQPSRNKRIFSHL